MSRSRVLTILQKDLIWARSNLRILVIMILPLFLIVFFSLLGRSSTFVFSMSFVNAFVGIFSTSSLILEEKRKGTLLALLTSPLTGGELLLGKFLFNLILCGVFSLLVILINGRLDLLLNPLALLTIIMFAGTTCFIGFLIGIFFSNEQVMGIFAPVLMFLFCFGDAAGKLAPRKNFHAYFPDYHLASVVKNVPFEFNSFLVHSLFAFFLFILSFFATRFYTQYYFSNSREQQFSPRLMGFVGMFVFVLVVSGIYYRKDNEIITENGDTITLSTQAVEVSFQYDQSKFDHQSILRTNQKSMEMLKPKKNPDTMILYAIRKLDSDEKNREMRQQYIKKDPTRTLLGYEMLSRGRHSYDQWIYIKGESLVLLRETFCGAHVFQYYVDVKLEKAQFLEQNVNSYHALFDSIKVICGSGTD